MKKQLIDQENIISHCKLKDNKIKALNTKLIKSEIPIKDLQKQIDTFENQKLEITKNNGGLNRMYDEINVKYTT